MKQNILNKLKMAFYAGIICLLLPASVHAEELDYEYLEPDYESADVEYTETDNGLYYQELTGGTGNLNFIIRGNLPIGANFTVKKIKYADEIQNCNEAINFNEPGHYYDVYGLYDIVVYDGYGNEFQPVDYGEEVQVVVTDTSLNPFRNYSVHRIEDYGTLQSPNGEELAVTTEMNGVQQSGITVAYETEHFTKYTVDALHYYTLPDGEETPEATIVGQHEHQGITWTLFDDGLLILTGDGEGKSAPWYGNYLHGGFSALVAREYFTKENAQLINKVYIDCRLYDECIKMFCCGAGIGDGIPELKITEIKIGPNFQSSNIKKAAHMFDNAKQLTYIENIENWDVSSIVDATYMFYNCKSLTSLNLNNWVTTSFTDMGGMFINCSGLTSLNIEDWDTSNVTDMSQMFAYCTKLTNLDLNSLDTSNVEDMSYMFDYCTQLSSLNIKDWDVSNVTTMYNLFEDCSLLTEVDIANWDTSKVQNMGRMFKECEALTHLDINDWDVSSVKNMTNMFDECRAITNIDIGKWNASQVTDVSSMFGWCAALVNVKLGNFDSLTNISGMFYYSREIKEIDLSGFDTSNVTQCSNFLYYCSPMIIKLPKKTNSLSIPFHASYYYEEPYPTAENPSPNPRFNNTLVTEIPKDMDQGDNPTRTVYRKIQIQYKLPKELTTTEVDPILQQEYICPYNKYPNATSPEPAENKVITWVKSTTYPDCPYEAYKIEQYNSIYNFNLNTNFANKGPSITVLRGVESSAFKVTVPAAISAEQSVNSDFSILGTVAVDIKSSNDNFWVSVVPRLTSGKMSLSDGSGHTSNMTVTMPQQKVYYSEVKNTADVGEGYREKALELTVAGNITYPAEYTGTLIFDITSGTGTN